MASQFDMNWPGAFTLLKQTTEEGEGEYSDEPFSFDCILLSWGVEPVDLFVINTVITALAPIFWFTMARACIRGVVWCDVVWCPCPCVFVYYVVLVMDVVWT